MFTALANTVMPVLAERTYIYWGGGLGTIVLIVVVVLLLRRWAFTSWWSMAVAASKSFSSDISRLFTEWPTDKAI